MWLYPLSAGVSPRESSGRTTTGSPGLEPLDPGADLGDGARHLVPDHLRWAHASVHRAVRDVKIGAAHAAVRDLEPHLAVARSPASCAQPENALPS